MSTWKIVFGFLWEYFVSKDVRTGKPKHHRIRFILYLIMCASIFYNFNATKRLIMYYNAYNTLEQKYIELKGQNEILKDDNRHLEQTLILYLNKHFPNTDTSQIVKPTK